MRTRVQIVVSIMVITLLFLFTLPLRFVSIPEQSAGAQICRTINNTGECVEQSSNDHATISVKSAPVLQQQHDPSQTQSPPFISDDKQIHSANSQSGHDLSSEDIQSEIPSVVPSNIPFP